MIWHQLHRSNGCIDDLECCGHQPNTFFRSSCTKCDPAFYGIAHVYGIMHELWQIVAYGGLQVDAQNLV